MATFTDASEWKPIYQLATTDPVIGGAPSFDGSDNATVGYANAAAKRLANRTKYLLDGVANATLIANGAYPASKRNAVLSGEWDNTTKLPVFLRASTATAIRLQAGTVLSFAAGFDATTGRAIDYIVKLTSNVDITPTYSSGATRYIVAQRNATTGAVTISALSVKPVVSYIEPDPATANMIWFNLSNGVSYKHNGTTFTNNEGQYCLIGEIKFTTSGSGFSYVKAFDINPRDIGTIRTVARITNVLAYGNDDFYLTCDGTAVSRTTYAELFQRIGTTYGSGDGSTTFNLPDFSASTLTTGTPTYYLTYQIKYQ